MVSHDPRFYVSPLNSLPEVAEGAALPPKLPPNVAHDTNVAWELPQAGR